MGERHAARKASARDRPTGRGSGQVAAALRESEARFHALARVAPVVVFMADARGRCTYVNERWWDVAGLTPDSALDDGWTRALHPDDREWVVSEWRQAVRNGLPFGAEYRLLTPGDMTTRVYMLVAARRDGDGRAQGYCGTIIDITAHKRATDAQGFLYDASIVLASSLDYETTLQRVARLSLVWLADWCVVDLLDEHGQVSRVAAAHADPAMDEAARQLTRFPPRPDRPHPVWLVLRTGQPLLEADEADTTLETITWDAEHLALLRRLGTGSFMAVPLVARGRTLGVMKFVRASTKRPYGSEDLALAKEIAQRCALAVDNARLYEAERQARARAEQLAAERAAILAQIGDGVVVADAEGRVTFMNAVARERFGLAGWEEGAAGDGRASVLDAAGAPYRPEDLPHVRAARRGEVSPSEDLRIRRPGGVELTAEATATPVVTADGARIGAVLTVRDVTARRELERQKEEFFANASHDLRTPIATIKGAIEAFMQHEPAGMPAPLRRMLAIIAHEAGRMATLVDDLLEWTRLEAGRVQLHPGRGDLRAVARRAAGAIEPLAQRRGQRVAVELPERPVLARVDGERLERALLNLLANAHQYGREGGTIRLSVARRDGEALLAVADDGPGIAGEDQGRLFERFYRPRTAATRRQPGSGLGLLIGKPFDLEEVLRAVERQVGPLVNPP